MLIYYKNYLRFKGRCNAEPLRGCYMFFSSRLIGLLLQTHSCSIFKRDDGPDKKWRSKLAWLARLLFYIKYMEKYIENKDGWTRSGSHNSPLRCCTFSMYIDLFINYKTKIDGNTCTIFQSIHLFYLYLVVASVEEKSIHVYAQSKKH